MYIHTFVYCYIECVSVIMCTVYAPTCPHFMPILYRRPDLTTTTPWSGYDRSASDIVQCTQKTLVGGLLPFFIFSIYWVANHPN